MLQMKNICSVSLHLYALSIKKALVIILLLF